MKILYIYIATIEEPTGVNLKIQVIFRKMQELGITPTLLALSHKAEKPDYLNSNCFVIPASYRINMISIYNEIDAFLNRNNDYNAIYFRYPIANKALFNFLKKYPSKFYFEHNTKEIEEMYDWGLKELRKYKFKLGFSYFKLLRNSFRPFLNEWYYGHSCIRLAKGGYAVTQELVDYERNRYKNYNCLVVTNGIDTSLYKPMPRILKDNQKLIVVSVVNDAQSWHGLNELLNSIGDEFESLFELRIIGNVNKETVLKFELNKSVRFIGHLSKNDLLTELQNAHIGIGSLTMYKIGLEQGAPLKVREYLASGLPVIVGYYDPDIENSKLFKKCSIKIDLRKEQINWSDIYDWAKELYSTPDLSNLIANEAIRTLDYKVKVGQMPEIITLASEVYQ